MTFHVGQKVVCVDASINPEWGKNGLVKGRIYTVREVIGGIACRIEEVDTPSPVGFFLRRFRPVVERKTDISIFTKMLTGKKVRA